MSLATKSRIKYSKSNFQPAKFFHSLPFVIFISFSTRPNAKIAVRSNRFAVSQSDKPKIKMPEKIRHKAYIYALNKMSTKGHLEACAVK